MNIEDFLIHTKSESSPEAIWSPALQALWYAERGDWEMAHTVCQEGGTPEGAWVHANLHREEGDLGNAQYWYSRAGKSASDAPVEDERKEILQALLDAS